MQTSAQPGSPTILSDISDVRHLLRRLAFAATPQAEASIKDKSLEDTFDGLVEDAKRAPLPAPPECVRTVWTNGALLFTDMSKEEYQKRYLPQEEIAIRDIELLRQWWLQEMISGSVPLRENLALFFHGTFGSRTRSINVPHALHGLNDLMRRSCFGTIPAMLEQMVHDPAMMIFIDMDAYRQEMMREEDPPNFRPAQVILNNWTVGAGQYTQQDVEELCRALTGWVLVAPSGYEPKRTVDPKGDRRQRRTGLVPVFQPEHFVRGPKTILGIRDDFDARSAILFLARHPATARRFSRLLIRYFGVEDSTKRLERKLVQTYKATDGSIVALLRDIVLSEEFWSSESRWQLIKSPVHLAAGACRQLEIAAPPLAALSSWLNATGQTFFETGDFGSFGWPGHEDWVTPPERLAVRYQLASVLMGDMPRLGIAMPDPSSVSRPVAKGNLGTTLQNNSVAAIVERLDPAPTVNLAEIERSVSSVDAKTRINGAVRQILSTPQYQLA